MADKEIEAILEEIVDEVCTGAARNDSKETYEDREESKTVIILPTVTSYTITPEPTQEKHDVTIEPRFCEQYTQTTCICQCTCNGSMEDVKDPTIVIQEVVSRAVEIQDEIQSATQDNAPPPNKRKRGRPRKHPAPDVQPKPNLKMAKNESVEKVKPTRIRKAKNVSYVKPDLDETDTKVQTINLNHKDQLASLPRLKLQLKRVDVKQRKQNAKPKTFAQFKSEVLGNLEFVEVSKSWNTSSSVSNENIEDDSLVTKSDDIEDSGQHFSERSSGAPSRRLIFEETHGCELCGKHFKEMVNLRDHKRNQHGIDDEEDGQDDDENGVWEMSNDNEYLPSETEVDEADDDDPEYTPGKSAKNEVISRKKREEQFEVMDVEDHDDTGSNGFDLTKLFGAGASVMKVPREVTIKGEKFFTCVICSKAFKGEAHFLRHLGTHTGHRPFVCTICGEGFSRKRNLARHQVTHSSDRPFPCDICQKRFKTAASLKFHQRLHDNLGEKQFECDECDKKFAQKVGLEIHKSTIHEGKRPYKCDYCDQAFGRMSHLMRHTYKHKVEMEGLDMPFECNKCGKRYAREEQLKVHERSHTGERPYICLICDKSFKSSGDLAGHRRVHSDIRQHICHICGAGFKVKKGLTRHMGSHSDDRPHICEICGLSFKYEQTLRIHQRTHTGTKPYKCTMCDYACGQLCNLKSHMAKHSEERNCTCEVCGKQFKHKRHMKRHMLTHSDEKKFQCELCGKSFSRPGSRNKHMLVHSGQRPYPCKHCGKSFRQSGALAVHMMIHNNQRPFTCDVCNSTFRRYAHLQRHKRTHTGEKPYTCPICHKGFTRPVCLPNHMKRHEKQGEFVPMNGGTTINFNTSDSFDNTNNDRRMDDSHDMENYNNTRASTPEGSSDRQDDNSLNLSNQSHQADDLQVGLPPTSAAAQGVTVHPFLFTVPYFAPQF